MNLYQYKIHEPQRISFLAQDFSTRLLGAWDEGFIFFVCVCGDNLKIR